MKLLERIGARRKRRHPETPTESPVETLLRSTPTDAPVRAPKPAGLVRRRKRFRYGKGVERSAGGFTLPQRDHTPDPGNTIRPARGEDVDARREGRHKRRAAERRRQREVRAAAHALRITRTKAAKRGG